MRFVRAIIGSISVRRIPGEASSMELNRGTDRAADTALADKREAVLRADSIHGGKVNPVLHGSAVSLADAF
jgi:hypothetical protein